ncbi:MAG TPA: polysaccharide pyruvyl transferase family protein [Candidatus Saccharimonadia bacterium]|nr:polysaccharide pyruvyl transferase family protein [Candidatus Saccharimonadia bacterium]
MNNHRTKPKRVLLLGSYGRGNIGDDVFLIAATKLLAGYEIAINAATDGSLPAEVQDKVLVLRTEDSSDWRQKAKVLLQAKAIIYGGGDLWVELFGDKRPRQALWKMFLLNLAARMLGKKVLYIGCGAGKLEGFSLTLARLSAHLAHGIILRDEVTREVLALKDVLVLPDLTITLCSEAPKPAPLPLRHPIKLVISLLYYIPEPERNFEPYIQRIADCLNQLDSRNRFEITLLPMLTARNTPHNDIWASERLMERLAPGHQVKIAAPTSVGHCQQILSDADIIIGSRLHANILATWAAKPCIGVAYRPKVARFFERNNLDQNCLDLDNLGALPAVMSRLIRNYDHAARQAYAVWEENAKQGRAYESFIQTHL